MNVFNCFLNSVQLTSLSHRLAGKLFQIRGPAAAKHLSPKRLWTRVTEHFLPEEDEMPLSSGNSTNSLATATFRYSCSSIYLQCTVKSQAAALKPNQWLRCIMQCFHDSERWDGTSLQSNSTNYTREVTREDPASFPRHTRWKVCGSWCRSQIGSKVYPNFWGHLSYLA